METVVAIFIFIFGVVMMVTGLSEGYEEYKDRIDRKVDVWSHETVASFEITLYTMWMISALFNMYLAFEVLTK